MKLKILLFFPLVVFFELITASQSLAQQFVSVKADTIALMHVKIIDGTGQPAKNDQTLIIIKEHIAQLGKTGSVNVPVSAKILDCSGKTIIPGMIMMHEHLFYGENVSPYEIEEALAAHPSVKVAGVIGIADKKVGQVPYAFVELKKPCTVKELTTYLESKLDYLSIPKVIKIVKSLPRTTTGKIDREKLRNFIK